MRGQHRIVAGVVDAGLSSLATFIVGFYATRNLEPAILGAYALAFSVFVLSGLISAMLVFTPTEIAAVDYPRGHQLQLLRQSLMRGSIVSLLAAVATSAWILIAPAELDRAALSALVVSGAGAAFLSPLQDHLRRMLHLAHESWRSVAVAIVQILATLVAIVVLAGLEVDAPIVPFGALIMANAASLSVGLLLSSRDLLAPTTEESVSRERLLRSGRPLLAVGLVPSVTTFVVSWLVTTIAGSATLGYVHAARIVSQPVAVLQKGLGSVLGPRATRAASQRDQAALSRVTRLFGGLIIVAGAFWMAAVAIPAPWNVLPEVLPLAYVVPGLVAAAIIAFTIQSLSAARRFEMYGAAKEKSAVKTEVQGNVVRLCLALFAGVIGPFVVPIGLATLGVIRLIRYGRTLREYYGTPAPAGAGARGGSAPADDLHEVATAEGDRTNLRV
ncbi:MAG: hypothetical protein AB1Z67_06730 [Candidatus Limnocylindrales bacterium]